MQPPEGPPIWAALNFLPFCMPPPMRKIISPMGMPMGTSTMPVLTMSPARANTFVPLACSVPKPAYQPPPFSRIGGMLASVSTLLMIVGAPKRPFSKGKGGLGRGSPRLPSMEFKRAVSSPQTKAPAPMRISRSKSKPEPRMSLPSSPYSRACSMAALSRSTAMGYSART